MSDTRIRELAKTRTIRGVQDGDGNLMMQAGEVDPYGPACVEIMPDHAEGHMSRLPAVRALYDDGHVEFRILAPGDTVLFDPVDEPGFCIDCEGEEE